MKFHVEVDGETFLLNLTRNGNDCEYSMQGPFERSGVASISPIAPNVYSLLLGRKSITVYLSQNGEAIEAWVGTQRRFVSFADTRDHSTRKRKASAAGPIELRALMPGKIVKLLVSAGQSVRAGQGIIVVEAMKMQNEVKAPKDGVVTKILVQESGTVAAGESMIIVE